MPSFTDVARLEDTVVLQSEGGGPLVFTVRGIGLDDLGRLIFRFPAIAALLPDAIRPGTQAPQFDVSSVMGLGSEIIAAIIACATGHAGDAAEEAALAERLVLEKQLEFIEAIIRLSLPGGIYPFVTRIYAMLSGVPDLPALPNGAAAGRGEAMSSQSPSTS